MIFKKIYKWFNPDLSRLEDGGKPFTEWKLTLSGTQFSFKQCGYGGFNCESEKQAQELKTHLESRGLIAIALKALASGNPPQDPLDAIYPAKGA